MQLLRLKITDPKGFRSLQSGFEYVFRREWDLEDDKQQSYEFEPFVCAGPNGSGKSNLLEVLAAIFYQLELLRVQRSFLPSALMPGSDGDGLPPPDVLPDGFELEYLIRVPSGARKSVDKTHAHITVAKLAGQSPEIFWNNSADFNTDNARSIDGVASFDDLPSVGAVGGVSARERDFLLPQYVLGYSSGENEILSLPFFKMRFVQYDEYWNSLKNQLPYPGRPETRLAYMDGSFSQAILLCNLLFHDEGTLFPLIEETGLQALNSFQIIIKRSIEVPRDVAADFGDGHPAVSIDEDSGRAAVNLVSLLDGRIDEESSEEFGPILARLKRCATCRFEDEETDTLYLDYFVNQATKDAFQANFQDAVELFQALQVLLALNLYSVSENLKTDLYRSSSHYVTETVPTLASDERVMRMKHFWVSKRGVKDQVLLKSLSDGEHQMLHSLGLCLLFKEASALFLLDEPETHFNPDWRSSFVTRLKQCFNGASNDCEREMFVTTHTPFLISDSRPERVLVFKNEDRAVSVSRPDYQTLGASINKITMKTFGKKETIGGVAQAKLDALRRRFESDEDKEQILQELNAELGDSVEKITLINSILESMEDAP